MSIFALVYRYLRTVGPVFCLQDRTPDFQPTETFVQEREGHKIEDASGSSSAMTQGRSAKPKLRDPFSNEIGQMIEFQRSQKQDTATLSASMPESTPSLMLPPPRPVTTPHSSRVPPKLSSTLRPPPSVAATLRAPHTQSIAPPIQKLAPSTSTLSPSQRPSRKVLLEPGHSPLDWANLIAHPPTPTFLRGDSVPPQLIKVPPSMLKHHNGRKDKATGKVRDAWGAYQGKVYNMTPYLDFHPGGRDQLMRGAGKDAERLFNEVHPWVSWENMLGECLVGILVNENEAGAGTNTGGQMDEMD